MGTRTGSTHTNGVKVSFPSASNLPLLASVLYGDVLYSSNKPRLILRGGCLTVGLARSCSFTRSVPLCFVSVF